MSPPPPPLKADSEALQPLSSLGDSCSAPILEPERSALLQEALADSQLQVVKAQLESRGLGMNTEEAQAVQLVGGEQLLIPFGDKAHLVWTRANGQTAALGLVRQGNKTVNITATGEERIVRFLNPEKAQKLLRKLREQSKFQQFEGKLSQQGKRLGQVRVLFDETNKIAILGIANEGNAEKIAHQVRIKLKADKDDEPEENAEPAIQATACGQAMGEAVSLSSAAMRALTAPPGGEGGDFGGGYEGPQICTSQWGYDYLCFSRTPAISLSTTSLTLPQTFITQQTQGTFVIWNSGGGKLTGTVTTSAPFSIVSGGSFSLNPGQPQEVVAKFSSATAGSFSKSVTISSNGGKQDGHSYECGPQGELLSSDCGVWQRAAGAKRAVQPDGDMWLGDREGGLADREEPDGEERGHSFCDTDPEHGSAVQDRECAADAGAGAEWAGDVTRTSQGTSPGMCRWGSMAGRGA